MNTNRVAAFLGVMDEAACMGKAVIANGHKTVSVSVSAAFVCEAIASRWVGTDKSLAEAACIAVSTLADMKASGTKANRSAFKRFCKALKIDLRNAARGRIVPIAEAPAGKRQDLHELLNLIIGTKDEAVLERVMQGLVQAG